MRRIAVIGALLVTATGALAQDFGSAEDQDFASQLWQTMVERNLAGPEAIQAFPYPGTDPHGMMLETFYTDAEIDGLSGAVVIKRNYGPEGVSVDEVLGSAGEHLAAVTIMFRREGFAPDAGDWFWAKYLPDGSLDQSPDGMPLVGKVTGCTQCHAGAEGGDYLFTTDAKLD